MSNELSFVPLNKLVRSSLNVRKTGAESIDDLAASIAVHGLLQNLTLRRSPPQAKPSLKPIPMRLSPAAAGWPRSNPWQSSRRFPKTTRFRAKL